MDEKGSYRFIAHKRKEDGSEQTTKDHLLGTAVLCRKFASAFCQEALGYITGLFHDIGKYSLEFLKHIVNEDNAKVDHSTAGMQELLKRGLMEAAFCVAGHHGGIPNGGDKKDGKDNPSLMGRWKKDIPNYQAAFSEMEFPEIKRKVPEGFVNQFFFIRMLYSCLVDADYLDTEAFMSNNQVKRGNDTGMEELLEKLNQFIEKEQYLQISTEKEIDVYRTNILKSCIEAGKRERGLFSLTVPTGGGKTISSLAFALNHAVQNGLERVIYVIPYCSIIDQTVSKFKDILGKDCVLEHHSGAEYETDENGIDNKEKNVFVLATENWDMPVIVTTSVQFFESLYSNRSSKCRKLHHIANSVVIFDEAQMIPVPYLMPCISAIGQLIEHYRASVVLCTATQPALDTIFEELGHKKINRMELAPDVEQTYAALRRTTFQYIGRITDDELTEQLQKQQQVLCVVNSRKQARTVFQKLSGEGNYHLSTLMYSEHRRQKLAEIRTRLENELPCRVVSTSLIEAGVDLDFPMVYRAAAGLDAMIQAAGRCNREGLNPREQSMVSIFESCNREPIILKQNFLVSRSILDHYEDIGSPEAVKRYFQDLYEIKGKRELDQKGILNMIQYGSEGTIAPFVDVANAFRLIENNTKTIYIPLGDGEKYIKDLQEGIISKELYRGLGRFGVSVYEEDFYHLCRTGDVIQIEGNGQSGILQNCDLYKCETGLDCSGEEGKGLYY